MPWLLKPKQNERKEVEAEQDKLAGPQPYAADRNRAKQKWVEPQTSALKQEAILLAKADAAVIEA